MIMFDISEWIINLVVLGLGLVFWCLAILLMGMIITISNKWIKENLIK
jgi:Na+-transporting methylmalonyl-CoA/oxaloacetate decarboxylase gamma subunit